jgi:hypothetical protein
METALFIVVALVVLGVIGMGAMVALPATVAFCILGFLIGGGSGLMVGMVLGGIAGWIVLARA